jgi:hypothetical protein
MSEARLHVSDSQGRRVVVLDRAQFLIGRRTAADLQIVSTDVSREHAEIVQDEGRFLLRDRGSRYGTFVNGEQITERVLEHGDRIRLGRTDAIELVFATDGAKTTGFLDASSDVTNLRQMAAILNGLRALGSGRVLDEVLTLVMDSALEVTKAERGFMMLAGRPARSHDRRRHPPCAVCAAAGIADVRSIGTILDRSEDDRCPLPRRPREEHHAVRRDARVTRSLCHAGGAGHRLGASLR